MTNKIGADGLFIGAPSRTFYEAISACFENYFNFSGRASRSEFWFFFLFTFLAGVFTGFVDSVFFGWDYKSQSYGPTSAILIILTLIPSHAVAWRRLHDTNKSGWLIGFYYLGGIIYASLFTVVLIKFENHPVSLFLFSIIGIAFIVYAVTILVYLCTKGDLSENSFDGYKNVYALNDKPTELIDINTRNNTPNNSYLLAMEEYDSDKRDKALWAKCFALCDGDESKTKATYVKERASTINKSIENNPNHYTGVSKQDVASASSQIINVQDESLKVSKPNHDFVSMSLADKLDENSIDYKSRSDKFLLQNGLFDVIKHGSIEIMLLKNGRAAVQVGDEIKVFENEFRLKTARLNEKYPGGLIVTIKTSDLLTDETLKENAAKKLNYKNMHELQEKVNKREPTAMFDMANILLDLNNLPLDKQKALVLLESAAINGHAEAEKLWLRLSGNSNGP